MLSKISLFILFCLLVMMSQTANSWEEGVLSGPWGEKKLSLEETLAMRSAGKKVAEASKQYGEKSPQAHKALEELIELASKISGQPKPKGKQEDVQLPIYNDSGRLIAGTRGKQRDPSFVTAEIDFSGEFATLDLNKYRGRSQEDVTPTSEEYIKVLGITPILDDTTKTPASYGWWINQTLDRLTIKSSNANDSSSIRVWMMVQ